MKKFLLLLIIIVLNIGALLFIYEVYPISDLRGKGTEIIHDSSKQVLIIQKNKECIPVRLNLYDDNTYELFTEYAACKLFETCTLQLKYTKSIKGSYNFDLSKIIEDDNIVLLDTIEENNLVDYEIYPFSTLMDKYKNYYGVKKGQNNKNLNKLLEELDLNINKCAIPDYN